MDFCEAVVVTTMERGTQYTIVRRKDGRIEKFSPNIVKVFETWLQMDNPNARLENDQLEILEDWINTKSEVYIPPKCFVHLLAVTIEDDGSHLCRSKLQWTWCMN